MLCYLTAPMIRLARTPLPSATMLAVVALVACGKRDTATSERPGKDPALTSASATSLASVSAAPSGSVPAPSGTALPTVAPPLPVLAIVPLEKPKWRHALYPIDGALLVSDMARIGRILPDTDKIQWLGDLPSGHNDSRFVSAIEGAWPDRVDVAYLFDGRSPSPAYLPFSGKGAAYAIPAGGTMTDPQRMTNEGIDFGGINAIVTVGASTLLAYESYLTGTAFRTVRGPPLARKSMTPKEAGCADGEVTKVPHRRQSVAIAPRVLGATPAGTLLALGALCEKRGDAVEVWDAKGKSRIVPLPDDGKGSREGARFFPIAADEILLWSPGTRAVLHYTGGAFQALPVVEASTTFAFLSVDKKLHVSDGMTLFRFDDGSWSAIGRFAGWPGTLTAMAAEGGALWAIRDDQAVKVVSRPRDQVVAARPDCKSPFVYVSDVAAKNETNYSFPTTRKALSSFDGVDDLSLVEVVADGTRRLGVVVTSQAQGEALIAHLGTTMKDEHPRLLCFAPTSPRVIAMKGK